MRRFAGGADSQLQLVAQSVDTLVLILVIRELVVERVVVELLVVQFVFPVFIVLVRKFELRRVLELRRNRVPGRLRRPRAVCTRAVSDIDGDDPPRGLLV